MDHELRAGLLEGILRRLAGRARSLFPLGIAARLALSFFAVAILAATANFIARESVSVILWRTHPATAARPPASLKTVVVAPAAPTIDTHPTEVLAYAADRFERACRSRASLSTPTDDAEYFAAKDALRRAVADFSIKAPGSTPTVSIMQRDASFVDRGQQLVHVADQRRIARTEYVKTSQSINDLMQASINGAWKLFGRVIAHQSLLERRAQFDAIRQRSDGIVAGEEMDAATLDLLIADEKVFAAALNAGDGKFLTAESADWTAHMKTGFAELVRLRATLQNLNSQYAEDVRRFSQAHGSFFAAINAAALIEPPKVAATVVVPAVTSRTLDTATAEPAMPELAEETSLIQRDNHAQHLMAAVTAAVLLIVTVISVLTVISIVKPVRSFLQAAAQLADGKPRIQMPRGGIRELDVLADAFNGMASRLLSAQEASRAQHDNLEEKVLERTHKLQKLSEQDPLTSLPNRRHLSALLNRAIERAHRENRRVGVFFMDIDNFKNFNDSLGHVFGDRVLMSVANRLEEVADGLGFVARLGGDEFTFVYEEAASEQDILDMGLRLVSAFQQLVSVDDRELSVSVSVGASIYPDHERDAEGLLRAADSALFRAKEMGRSRLALFTPELIESAAARFAIEQGLRRALEHGELELVYQPEVNLTTMEVGLVEALLRWRMPDGRVARPGEFLSVAEQSGMISEISSWVLRTAVAAAARWHHGEWPAARVAINISPRQLLDPRFTVDLAALLREFDLPSYAIELELTESVLQTGFATVAALRNLHEQGFGIALDDFGTGYSSLTSLEQLPLTRIKLDRSLIESIDTSARSAAIARAIIDLCAGLELEVTAEGIERPAQLAWLLGSRSMYLQGYLLAEGVPFEQVVACCDSLIPKMHHLLLSLPVVSKVRMVENAGEVGLAHA